MSIYFDMRQIEDIKKALYESIKSKGIDIQPEEWFANYSSRIREIVVDTGEVKPYFLFYDDPPRIQNYVFGGGVEASLEKIYISYFFNLFKTHSPKIEVGERTWCMSTFSREESSYLGFKPVNANLTYFIQPPTVTENVWPEENE